MDGSNLVIPTAHIFEPFEKPSRYKGAHGGRGSGKSWFFARKLVDYSIKHPGSRLVCVREVQKSLKESVKLLIEDSILDLGVADKFNVQDQQIRTLRDGLILFQGMQEHTKESVKSLENFEIGYVEEAQTMTAGSLEMLRPTIRSPGSELWFSWNPRSATDPVDQLLRGPEPPPDAIVIQANYYDNPFFPDVLEQERLYDKINVPDRYTHIWRGEYQPQALGAIWNLNNIREHRRREAPEMDRILVSIDHAVSSEEYSDEHGIIVAGKGMDGRGYVLDDASMRGDPAQWATAARVMFYEWEADAYVVERNMGGDLVAHTIRSVHPNAPIVQVVASRGKHVRAEPISSLYGLGRISHIGSFPELEAQMVLMTAGGYEGEGSPDRVDALVWAFSELFPRLVQKRLVNPPVRANSRYNPHAQHR